MGSASSAAATSLITRNLTARFIATPLSEMKSSR
jgi:hypothetical protein